jgi:hypothetical protein
MDAGLAAVSCRCCSNRTRDIPVCSIRKIAVIVRNDLAPWQALNVTAFLMTGIVGQFPAIIGEPYRDRSGNVYNALSAQPIIVLSADAATIAAIHSVRWNAA